jgi:branched-chain amino acid transport system permease protein
MSPDIASVQNVAQNVIDAISLGSIYALLTLGLALMFGVMRLLNWAYGELMTVGAYTLVVLSGTSLAIALPVMIAMVVLCALATELAAFRPVRQAGEEAMLITSFGVSFFLQSLALLVFTATPQGFSVPAGLLKSVNVAGLSVGVLEIVSIASGILLLAGVSLMLRRSRVGIQIRAASEDFEMARLLGVRADRVFAVAFAVSGVLAAVGAFLYAAKSGVVTPGFGLNPLVIAFVAVIIGGMGSLVGGALGGFLIGVLSVVLQVLLPASLVPFRDAFLFGVVFAVLAVRPQGLIVSRSAVERV